MMQSFGHFLRASRKARGHNRAQLAAMAGIARSTLQQLESGRGLVASFRSVLAPLGLHVVGRDLPPASSLGSVSLGARLALLRRGRGLSQRALAVELGATPRTVLALERDGGRLESLERALQILGAGARLVPVADVPGFYSTSGTSSLHHGLETPAELLAVLHAVFGQFDLDPCAPAGPSRVQPVRRYTVADDGLARPWVGKVYCNPPYGRALPLWTAKARAEFSAGRASLVIMLLPARTDTRWWHDHIKGADVFMLKGRLAFGDGTMPAPFPSALVGLGLTRAQAAALAAALPSAWHMPAAA